MIVEAHAIQGVVTGIVRQFVIDPKAILDAHTDLRQAGVDSLDLVDIVQKIEDAYDIEIALGEESGIATIGDAVKIIMNKVGIK